MPAVSLGNKDQELYVSNDFHCMNSSIILNCCNFCQGRPIISEYFIHHPELCNTLILLEDIRIKTFHTISKILHSNPKLCLKLLLVLKKMYNIKRFHSFINKITRNSKIRMSLRLCKRFAQFCFNKNIWPYCWLMKPVKEISIKSCGEGVPLSVYFDNAATKITNRDSQKFSKIIYRDSQTLLRL